MTDRYVIPDAPICGECGRPDVRKEAPRESQFLAVCPIDGELMATLECPTWPDIVRDGLPLSSRVEFHNGAFVVPNHAHIHVKCPKHQAEVVTVQQFLKVRRA